MSLEAIAWALTQAPDVPPQCVSLLIGLANHADSRGRGAYAGQRLLAGYARKSDRSVRNDLGALLERGVIRLGDQSLAAHIPADARPVVYDLVLERKQASGRKQSSGRQLASAATSDRFSESPDQGERGGSGSVLPAGSEIPGGSEEQRERKQASYKPTDNQDQNSSTKSSAAKRGTRIPDDFAVTREMVTWARERCPHVDGRLETEKFINYWQAKAGREACKLDWVKTWQNWMLTAASHTPGRNGSGGTPAGTNPRNEHRLRR